MQLAQKEICATIAKREQGKIGINCHKICCQKIQQKPRIFLILFGKFVKNEIGNFLEKPL